MSAGLRCGKRRFVTPSDLGSDFKSSEKLENQTAQSEEKINSGDTLESAIRFELRDLNQMTGLFAKGVSIDGGRDGDEIEWIILRFNENTQYVDLLNRCEF